MPQLGVSLPQSVAEERFRQGLGVFDAGRAAQKAKYGGEFFPSSANEALTGRTFLDFFQTDKDTGAPKGIVAIDLCERLE